MNASSHGGEILSDIPPGVIIAIVVAIFIAVALGSSWLLEVTMVTAILGSVIAAIAAGLFGFFGGLFR